MSTRREFPLSGASLMAAPIAGSVCLTDAALAQPAAPNMPARNPWLADGRLSLVALQSWSDRLRPACGPRERQEARARPGREGRVERDGVQPRLKKVGADTIGFASGTSGILKILLTGKALEALSFTAYPGLEDRAKKANDKAVAALLADVDAARRAKDDAKLLAAIGGMDRLGVNFETGINGVYNLFDRDGFHYCVYGGTKVLKTTDDNEVRGPSAS